MTQMNSVVHFEMPYDDRERRAKFYRDAFGWQTWATMSKPRRPNLMRAVPNDQVARCCSCPLGLSIGQTLGSSWQSL